jgi:hypothetical protein
LGFDRKFRGLSAAEVMSIASSDACNNRILGRLSSTAQDDTCADDDLAKTTCLKATCQKNDLPTTDAKDSEPFEAYRNPQFLTGTSWPRKA